jgi:hypothetical protein
MPLLIALILVLVVSPARAQLTSQSLQAELARVNAQQSSLAALKKSNPARYAVEEEKRLDAVAALARKYASLQDHMKVASDAEAGVAKLADFVRFRLKDPRRAIALYRKSAEVRRIGLPGGAAFALIDIGDVEQFDLKDRAAAAAEYEKFAQALQGAPQRPEFNWMRSWLAHEIEFLRKGKRFDAVVSPEEADGFRAFLYFFGGGEMSRGEAAALNAPSSHLNFARAFPLTAQLKTERALDEWLTRNDPAGYWRASFLSLVGFVAQLPPPRQPGTMLFPGVPLPLDPKAPMTTLGNKFVRRK